MRISTVLFLVLVLSACGSAELEVDSGESINESELSSRERARRARLIQEAAAERGLTNGVLLVGIANSETYLAHCWSEARWACKGPASSSCGGGPVIAGSGDGPCAWQEGGLGYFQFDAGTYAQTLARYGEDVLTIEGNTRHAVDYVVDMTIRSRYVPGVSTREEAIAWLDEVRVDGAHWDAWIKTVVHYYNGCVPGRCSVYSQRYGKYSADTRDVYEEMGHDFWYGEDAPGRAPALDALGVSWSRSDDGDFTFGATAPDEVARVVFSVDGWEIGEASRREGFESVYTFSVSAREREVLAQGFDASGRLVAEGHGLIDVTEDYGVFVRQVGASEYEVGIERAPDGLAFLRVLVDERWELVDSISGDAESARLAVRRTFSTLGERRFTLMTYNEDGTQRGTLRRVYTLR